MDGVIDKYLNQLQFHIHRVVGDNLFGLYLIGSSCLDDFRPGQSDLDVLGVLSQPISIKQKNQLASIICHKNLNCPAAGLDLILLLKKEVTEISANPKFEFWYSTGATWEEEPWEEGMHKEVHVFIEFCRERGTTLFGQEPKYYFNPVNKSMLIEAFVEILKWHQTKILDDYHDPKGQNSVLNGCRILAYIKEGRFLSKSEGGKWFVTSISDNDTVNKCLSMRLGNNHISITKKEVDTFLNGIIDSILN